MVQGQVEGADVEETGRGTGLAGAAERHLEGGPAGGGHLERSTGTDDADVMSHVLLLLLVGGAWPPG